MDVEILAIYHSTCWDLQGVTSGQGKRPTPLQIGRWMIQCLQNTSFSLLPTPPRGCVCGKSLLSVFFTSMGSPGGNVTAWFTDSCLHLLCLDSLWPTHTDAQGSGFLLCRQALATSFFLTISPCTHFFFFFFSWPHLWHAEVPRQRLNAGHSSDNARSPTGRPPGNSAYTPFFFFFDMCTRANRAFGNIPWVTYGLDVFLLFSISVTALQARFRILQG